MASLRLAWLLACLLVLASSAQAERLALKSYTTADGLAHNHVYLIIQDSHGFMVVLHAQRVEPLRRLSLHDLQYRAGLPNPTINYLIESRHGVYWIATNAG